MLIWAAAAVAAMVFFSLILGTLTHRASVAIDQLDDVLQRIVALGARERDLGHEVSATGRRRRQLPANPRLNPPNP